MSARLFIALIGLTAISSHGFEAGCLDDMYDLTPDEKKAIEDYTAMFLERSFEAAKAAVADLATATVAYGEGRAGFAANRRAFGTKGVGFGVNPNGAVDHAVPVLQVLDGDQKPKTVVFGYACHCTTPGPSDEVAGDCNDVFGYLPSQRILVEGGYEADASRIYYGIPSRFSPQTEELVIGAVRKLMESGK